MAENTSPADAEAAAAAARAAEQARLRKERREAKIRAGGTARLNKITGLGGGVQRDAQPAPSEPAAAPSPPAGGAPQHADPDEVDISQHYYSPGAAARAPATPPDLDALLAYGGGGGGGGGFPPLGGGLGGPGGGDPFLDPSAQDDPMLKLLSQMMGGAPMGAGAGAGGALPQNPFFPGMGGGMGGMGGGMPSPFGMAPQQQPPAPRDTYSAVWRLVHFVLALGLGLYIATLTAFSGTKLERDRAAAGAGGDAAEDQRRRHFLWAFATAEAVLLTTRMLLDRGRGGVGGAGAGLPGLPGVVLGLAGPFLPAPVKGAVAVGARYARVFGTVRADLLVCVFVLGVCSWLRSA